MLALPFVAWMFEAASPAQALGVLWRQPFQARALQEPAQAALTCHLTVLCSPDVGAAEAMAQGSGGGEGGEQLHVAQSEV